MTATVLHTARITLEAETALSIVSGSAKGVFSTSLVMDANDLPAIPGSALAGVLRSLYREALDEAKADQLFGFQSVTKADDSQPSQLNVSWGCIQNSQGKAIQGLAVDNRLGDDPILKAALALSQAPVSRDRVRLNHKGVSEGMGKFDRAVLPAGYRFTVELSMWSETREPAEWLTVLALFKHPLFRLGGMTRAGLGKMKLVTVHQCIADLSTPAGRDTFADLSSDLNDLTGFSVYEVPETQHNKHFVTATIRLKPNSYWRVGQGSEPTEDNNIADSKGKFANLLPKLEERVIWNEQGTAEGGANKLLVPASSVKGALSHRIAFHANRKNKVWAEEFFKGGKTGYDKSEECEAVRTLFGFANENTEGKKAVGQAGCVYIDDTYRELCKDKLQLIMHNSIDRFSGGVRDHMLFAEEMVWGEGVDISLTIDKLKMSESLSSETREALQLALKDLCEGRLALGAGVSKGHGLFTGDEIIWSDGGEWLKEGV